MYVVWGPGLKVWGRWHAGLGIPVRQIPYGAALQRVTAPSFCAAGAWETPMTLQEPERKQNILIKCNFFYTPTEKNQANIQII